MNLYESIFDRNSGTSFGILRQLLFVALTREVTDRRSRVLMYLTEKISHK